MKNSGYELDINNIRYHHEIYLSDPRKCDVSKLKTVIRHPIKKCKIKKEVINMAKSMYQKREERKQKKLNGGENSGVNKIDIN